MRHSIDAIFEDGVFKPLSPVELHNLQRVRLTCEPWPPSEVDWIDRDFFAGEAGETDDSVSLEAVRQALAGIKGSLTEAIREERNLR